MSIVLVPRQPLDTGFRFAVGAMIDNSRFRDLLGLTRCQLLTCINHAARELQFGEREVVILGFLCPVHINLTDAARLRKLRIISYSKDGETPGTLQPNYVESLMCR